MNPSTSKTSPPKNTDWNHQSKHPFKGEYIILKVSQLEAYILQSNIANQQKTGVQILHHIIRSNPWYYYPVIWKILGLWIAPQLVGK